MECFYLTRSTGSGSAEMTFEEILISVWRQALVDGVEKIKLNGRLFPVRRTPKKRLRQVDFDLDGEAVRGLEQNPETSSRWAQLARQGHRIMQFLCGGRYIANVVDGKVTFYGRRTPALGFVK
jgi:hypothetical protein